MKGAELLRLLHRMARARGWSFAWYPDRGKGSHGLLVMNGRLATIPNLKAELKTGTFHGVLTELGITAKDLYGS